MLVQSALAAPVVSVKPSYLQVLQGQNFTVNITVDPAGAEVMGAQYTLYFNNSLNATNQEKGEFLSQDGASTNVFVNEINNTLCYTKYGEARIGVDYGVTSPGTLAIITFRAIEPGICLLNLSNVKLSDPYAQPITGVLINNGTIEIIESHFNISGFVFYNDGSPVNNPNVTVTNLNTGEIFVAETTANYYFISTDLLHVNVGDILHFNASDNLGNFTAFDHTVTQEEIDAGGFSQNITIFIPDTTPPNITNISVIPTKDSAIITWNTDEPSDSLVKYGVEPGNYTNFAYNSSLVTYHSILIANLTPNTTYYFVVNSTDMSNNSAQSMEQNFTTFPEVIVSISSASVLPGENTTASIIIRNAINVGIVDIIISYNQSVVHVVAINNSDFDFMDAVIDNTSGKTRIGAFQTSSPGLYGDVRIADVTLKAVGVGGASCTLNITIVELKGASENEISIPAVAHNGTFFIAEITPPTVVNPTATPISIPEDTDSVPKWGETAQLNITVTDDCGVANVTINLSSIGGASERQMTRIPGTNIWTVTVNASVGTAKILNEEYLPHNLTVCATDIFGNTNCSVSIKLVVMLNGDVSENGEVSLYDAMFLAKHVLGKQGFEEMNERLGEVSGNGEVSLYDAMFLAKHVLGETGFEVLR